MCSYNRYRKIAGDKCSGGYFDWWYEPREMSCPFEGKAYYDYSLLPLTSTCIISCAICPCGIYYTMCTDLKLELGGGRTGLSINTLY